MKKFIAVATVAAVGATAAVTSGPASAQQQYPLPQISEFSGSVTPTKAGTKRRPKGSTVSFDMRVPRESRATVDRLTFLLPQHVRMSAKGFTRFCPSTQITNDGPDSCHKSTRAGTGEAEAFAGSKRIGFDIRIFVGSRNELGIWVQGDEPDTAGIQAALRGLINRAGKPYFHKVTIDIPQNLQQPAPGLYANITRLQSSIKASQVRKGKRRHLVTTIGCPKDRKHRFQARARFVPNPDPPAVGQAKRSATAPCRR